MRYTTTSQYSYTGDVDATLNSLTRVQHPAPVDVSAVDTLLVPTTTDSNSEVPNETNQLVFMAMPMSWWLSGLSSNAVKYTPVSSNVNWSYVNASGAVFYVSRHISDLLLPNRIQTVTTDVSNNTMTHVFEPKFGLSRTDTMTKVN